MCIVGMVIVGVIYDVNIGVKYIYIYIYILYSYMTIYAGKIPSGNQPHG